MRSGAGERIGGYRVVRRLATGGTSDVLLAKAEGPHGFERSVVLKVLLAQFQDDAEAMAMFAREASAYARLSHASIVSLYDFFALEGQLVMVLEYVDGPSLQRLRGMLRTMGQHVPDRAALYVGARVFAALAAAHAARDDQGRPAPVIHRDVNPSNVLLPWDGQVKLADFGVAKVTGASHQSQVGVLKGTYGYMAPEQVTGEPVTPRADVYAGAILLWELLTKRRAFQRGALPEVEALRQMSEPRIPPLDTLRPDLPAGLRGFVRRALMADARARDVTADEAVSVLRSLVSDAEGRESLADTLGQVRHEPRASMTSMPPPLEEETVRVPMASQAGALSPKAPSKAPVPTAGARPEVPRAPVASSPSGVVTSAPKLGALGAAPKTFDGPVTKRASSPPPRPTPKRPSTPPPPETSPMPGAPPRAPAAARAGGAPIPGAPGSTGFTSPVSLLLGTPADPVALKAALDEILRDVPSTIPPDVFSVPGADVAIVNAPTLGALPPAPAPLISSRSPSEPLIFPSLDGRATADDEETNGGGSYGSVVRSEVPLPMVDRGPDAIEPVIEPAATTLPFPPVGTATPSPSPVRAESPSAAPPRASVAPAPDYASAAPPSPSAPPPDGVSVTRPSQAPTRVGPAAPVATPSVVPAAETSRAPAVPRRSGAWKVVLAIVVLASATAGVGWTQRERISARLVAARHAPAKASAQVAPSASTPPSAEVAPPSSASAPASAAASAETAPAPSASASAPASAAASAETAPAPSASAPASAETAPATSASATAPSSAVRPGTGLLKTTGATPHRRIFVDDVTVGQTPETLTVKCGMRSVKIGSSGRVQRLDVPCGGEVVVSDR